MQAHDQTAVIDFLSRPETHQGANVERIITHAAYVFLAGDKAYKLKRAIKLPFLDFTTLESRRVALEAELRLNRRTAPDLYLMVLPITRDAQNRLSFEGAGPVVEWALVMRRFDQAGLLDVLARQRALRPETMDALADAIAAMHQSASKTQRGEGECFSTMSLGIAASLRGTSVKPTDVARLERVLAEACAQGRPYLDARSRDGFVRHCHGDLHLRNIVLIDGRPVPFDALEFDMSLATCDIYYDLSFLLMDLCYRGLKPFAARVLNRYAHTTGDWAGLRGLPLFMATRAAVRATVSVMSAAAVQDENERRELTHEAQAYADLANSYLPPAQARIIAVGGLSGTGKSTIAMGIAHNITPAPGAIVLRSDTLRKRLHGVADTTRLPPEAYAPAASAQVYDALMAQAAEIVAAGHSVIVDAVFADAAQRAQVEATAKRAGVPFTGLWLEAPLPVRRARVGARVADASDADVALAEAQEQRDVGAITWARVDASGTIDQACDHAIMALAKPHP